MNFKKTGAKEATDKQLKAQLEDFDILEVLGKGAFGKVYMVQKKDTN